MVFKNIPLQRLSKGYYLYLKNLKKRFSSLFVVLIFLETSISGYVIDLFTVKVSKRSGQYLNFSFQEDQKLQREVCFSSRKESTL